MFDVEKLPVDTWFEFSKLTISLVSFKCGWSFCCCRVSVKGSLICVWRLLLERKWLCFNDSFTGVVIDSSKWMFFFLPVDDIWKCSLLVLCFSIDLGEADTFRRLTAPTGENIWHRFMVLIGVAPRLNRFICMKDVFSGIFRFFERYTLSDAFFLNLGILNVTTSQRLVTFLPGNSKHMIPF